MDAKQKLKPLASYYRLADLDWTSVGGSNVWRAETALGTFTIRFRKKHAGNGWYWEAPDKRHGPGFETLEQAILSAEDFIARAALPPTTGDHP